MSKKKNTLPRQLVFVRDQLDAGSADIKMPLGVLRAFYKSIPRNQRHAFTRHPLADDRRHVIMPENLARRLVYFYPGPDMGVFKW